MVVETSAESGANLSSTRLRSSVSAGVTRQTLLIPESESMPSGSYELGWWFGIGDSISGNSTSGVVNSNLSQFSVLDRFDRDVVAGRLEDIRAVLQPESYQTILFLTDELERDLAGMRSYDLGEDQMTAMANLAQILTGASLNGASEGTDTLAEARGLSRKAFRSLIDGTLQPYSVIVPESYDPARKYPLVVYLHGSDSSEMDLEGFEFVVPDCCIGVGPFARGRTNFYLGEEPQADIQEAIDAVASSYSVDTDRIVVVGFSMGGWGSYLTYHTRPDRFLGLAAFSGIPFIPGMDDPESVPDFRRDEFLDHLGSAQVFISHGRQDNVGTIDVIDAFVEKLRSNGADVVYVVDDERGHSRPTQPEIERYQQWLLEVVSSPEGT
jgi:predicted esterase